MLEFSKYLKVNQILIYEVSPVGDKSPRWEFDPAIGWIDRGYTDEYTSCVIEAISTQKTATHRNTAAYVRTGDNELHGIPYPDHVWYINTQWNLPGFYAPVGGWATYLTVSKQVECSCGAVGYARVTNQPVTGHGPLCQITQMGL